MASPWEPPPVLQENPTRKETKEATSRILDKFVVSADRIGALEWDGKAPHP